MAMETGMDFRQDFQFSPNQGIQILFQIKSPGLVHRNTGSMDHIRRILTTLGND